MKIYHKLFDLDKSALLKALGIVCGITFCIYSVPFFTALFISAALGIQIVDKIGKLPMRLLVDSGLINIAYGVSGFLMSLVVVFISRSRKIENVVFAGITIAILHIGWWYMFISVPSLSLFFKVYWVLWMILNVAFLLGFAVLGVRFLNRIHHLKMHKAGKGVQ